MTLLHLPTGATLRHSSSKQYHLVADTADGPVRITSRDDLWPAVNTYHAAALKNPGARLWLLDTAGNVIRPEVDAGIRRLESMANHPSGRAS
jgi:hypothetical protein